MSVYGKKIVIDGIEYVAVPQKGYSCNDCAFVGNETGFPCESSEFRSIFGDVCTTHLNMILKKVAPKKKPENKCVVGVAPESAWGKASMPNMTSEVYGQPYLNPLDMMYRDKTVLVDNKPCKIIDVAGESGYDGMKHIITFQQLNKQPEKIKLAKVEATRGTNLSDGAMSLEQLDEAIRKVTHGENIPPSCMAKVNDKFIVCLSEPDGLKPADVPKQHYSEADAIKEAERLCKKHNQKFVVLKVVAEVSPMICPVTTKRG